MTSFVCHSDVDIVNHSFRRVRFKSNTDFKHYFKIKMEFLFGKKKTPAQMLRENQRLLTRAMRDLDRERASMEKQEKKIIADIKQMAKKNEMATVRIMAKDLVRTRGTCKKFMIMRANIQVRFICFIF